MRVAGRRLHAGASDADKGAYAVLGSYTEAEDVASGTWLRLAAADDRESINDVEGWALVAVFRRALDVLSSAR